MFLMLFREKTQKNRWIGLRFDSLERTVITNRFIKMNQTFQNGSLSLFSTDETRRLGRIVSVCGVVRHMGRVKSEGHHNRSYVASLHMFYTMTELNLLHVMCKSPTHPHPASTYQNDRLKWAVMDNHLLSWPLLQSFSNETNTYSTS